jgi:MFS family permease
MGAASSLDSAVIPQAAHDLGVSEVTESFGAIGSFLLGFGPGALVAGPFSEVLGRNQIYLPALTLFCLFIMASALAPDIGSQIVFRFVACVVGAAPSVCVGGSISDMFSPMEKTYMFPFFSLFGFGGAALGPVMGAWIAESPVLHSWRWAEWVTLMLAGVALAITFLFQPETYAPVLLSWKARQLRKLTGDDRYYAEHEIERIPLSTRLKTALRRPFVLAMHEPIILLISFYLCLVYVILFTFLSGFDFIFRRTYSISQGLTNTLFVAILVGIWLAYLAIPWIYNRTVGAQREAESLRKKQFEPEVRLWYAMLGAPVVSLPQSQVCVSAVGPNARLNDVSH